MPIIRLPSDGKIPLASLTYKNHRLPETKEVSISEIADGVAARHPGIAKEVTREVIRSMFEIICEGLLTSGEIVVGNTLYRLASLDGQPIELGEIAPEDNGLFVVNVELNTKPLSLKKAP